MLKKGSTFVKYVTNDRITIIEKFVNSILN